MAKWIEVPIFCNTKKTSALKELGLEVNDEDFEVRIGMINADKITGFYPDYNANSTVIHLTNGESFEIDLPYIDFKNQTI